MLEIGADPNAESKQWSTWWEQRYINFSHQSTWNRWMRPKALGAIWIWKWNFVYLCFRNSFIVGNNLTFCLGCHWPRNKDQQEAAEGEEEQDEEGKQFRFYLNIDFLFYIQKRGGGMRPASACCNCDFRALFFPRRSYFSIFFFYFYLNAR
jgi:hypothetical protein